MGITINKGNCEIEPEGLKPRCNITYQMALEQLRSLKARFKDCQQILDENGNVINAFPPQTLFRRPQTGDTTFLPVDVTTGFANQIPVMSFKDIGCQNASTGPRTDCCGKIKLHPEGFFGGLPSAIFYPDLSGNPPSPLYLTENYFDIDFNVWLEITGYSIMWEYLGPSGNSVPRIVGAGWETGCLKDTGVYRMTIMDACGNMIRTNIQMNSTLPPLQAPIPFNPQNNQDQINYYENTIQTSYDGSSNPRVYVIPYFDQNNNLLPGAFYDTSWGSIGCTVDFELLIDNACGHTWITVSTAGTGSSNSSYAIFSQIMQDDPVSPGQNRRYIFKNFDLEDFNLIVKVVDACGNVFNRTVTIDTSVPIYYRSPRSNVFTTTLTVDPDMNVPSPLTVRPHDAIYRNIPDLMRGQRFKGLFYTSAVRQAPITKEAAFSAITSMARYDPTDYYSLQGASVNPKGLTYFRMFPQFIPVNALNPIQGQDFQSTFQGTDQFDRCWLAIDNSGSNPNDNSIVPGSLDVDFQLVGPLVGLYSLTAEYQCSTGRRAPLLGIPNRTVFFVRDFLERYAFWGYRNEQNFVLDPSAQPDDLTVRNWGGVLSSTNLGSLQNTLNVNGRRVPFAETYTSVTVSQFLYTLPPPTIPAGSPQLVHKPLLSTKLAIQYTSVNNNVGIEYPIHSAEVALTEVYTPTPSGQLSLSRIEIRLNEAFSTLRVTKDVSVALSAQLGALVIFASIPNQMVDYVFTHLVYSGTGCATSTPPPSVMLSRFLSIFQPNTNPPQGMFAGSLTAATMNAFNANPTTRVELFRRGLLGLFFNTIIGTGPNQINITGADYTSLRNMLFNVNLTVMDVVDAFMDIFTQGQRESIVNNSNVLATLNLQETTFNKSNMQVVVLRRPPDANQNVIYHTYVDGVLRGTTSVSPSNITILPMTVRHDITGLPNAITLQWQTTPSTTCPQDYTGSSPNINAIFANVGVATYTLPQDTVSFNGSLLPASTYASASWLREVGFMANRQSNFTYNDNRARLTISRGSTFDDNLFVDYSFHGAYNSVQALTPVLNTTDPSDTSNIFVAHEPTGRTNFPNPPFQGFAADNTNFNEPSTHFSQTVWNMWNFGHGSFPVNMAVADSSSLNSASANVMTRSTFYYSAAVSRFWLYYFNYLTPDFNTSNYPTCEFFWGYNSAPFSPTIIAPTLRFNGSIDIVLPTLPHGPFTATYINAVIPGRIAALRTLLANRRKEFVSNTPDPVAGRLYFNNADLSVRYGANYTIDGSPYPINL